MSCRLTHPMLACLALICLIVVCGESRCPAAWWHAPHDCGTCATCGCPLECRVVPTKKEVKKDSWIVKTEPYCLVMPGGPCHLNSPLQPCNKSGCDPCAAELAKPQNPPRPVAVRTRQILERKEVICLVPSYKCTPVCPRCSAAAAQATPGSPSQAGQVPMMAIPEGSMLAPYLPWLESPPIMPPWAQTMTILTPSSAGAAATPIQANPAGRSMLQNSPASPAQPFDPFGFQQPPGAATSKMIAVPPPTP